MKSPRVSSAILGVGLTVLCAQADPASAAEIKVWTARAIATVLAEVGPEFERETGHRLSVTTDLSPAFVSRAHAGESFDVMITGSDPLAGLAKDGQIMADTRTHIARSGIGVGVRAGAPKPDITSVEAFKRALLTAKSIAYLKDVGSGIHVARVLERLGIADAMKGKVVRPESDIVSELVAKGEVEVGIVVIIQILTTPGVELVGPLPPALQSYVAFDAGVSANSRDPEAARALIRFLGSPVATRVITAQGMEPGIGVSR
jgi:molybdate transport system substrate-binding protein